MILEQIVNSTRKALAMRKSRIPLSAIERASSRQSPPRDFVAALQGDNVRLIAEIKRASPSKGSLRKNLDAASLANIYNQNGAAAISVLTESAYFFGSFADLDAVRMQVNLPLLCKDFIIDRYQIYEARAHGADAILLIAAILTQVELKAFYDAAQSLGMSALVEIHNRDELKKALSVYPRIIGINNRNLADFSIDLDTTIKLRHFIPSGVAVVSESGIHTREDVLKLQAASVNAVLVGEALVTSTDPAAKIAELLGRIGKSNKAQETMV